MIRDTAAQNKSLDNDYGATKGANAPASHQLALFAGDPNLDGTELTATGGYARVTVANNGTNWPAASDGLKVAAAQAFSTSTAAWSDVATHWALFDAADGTTCWDTGVLDEEIDVTAAGVTPTVAPKIFYQDWSQPVYGGNAYGSAPYAGGASGAAAPVVVTIPAEQIGRVRMGSAAVSLDVPVAALPAGLVRAVKVDKALAYPAPTLVDGRPT